MWLGNVVLLMDAPGDHELELDPEVPPELPRPPIRRSSWEPPPLPAGVNQGVEGYDPNKVYGVTRRFSLATLMLMMAGASLLLAGMNALGTPPYVSGGIILLCVATAIGQMFLFGGKLPREASLVVGAVFFAVAPLIVSFAARVGIGGGLAIGNTGEVIVWMFTGALFGAIPGYAAGCAVASVLLLMDLTESWLGRWRKAREPDDDPWPPPKNPAKILPPQEQPL